MEKKKNKKVKQRFRLDACFWNNDRHKRLRERYFYIVVNQKRYTTGNCSLSMRNEKNEHREKDRGKNNFKLDVGEVNFLMSLHRRCIRSVAIATPKGIRDKNTQTLAVGGNAGSFLL